MKPEKKIILGTLVLAIFIFIVAASSLYVQTQISIGNVCGCAIPLPLFIPFLASVGLFIGTLFYYFFLPNHETKTKIDKEIILKLFDPAEREIIKKLLENDGSCLQSKLTRETNLSKVQVFRTLESLIKKKIAEKERYGKTNTIKLNKQFIGLFPK
ncbi:MAG: hypothetical protein KAU95_04300 [Candidatus Aenigmarchaeota archaeon]|nr:hypothetical protein [Candidatus Aenigmarchaeota archaeon]